MEAVLRADRGARLPGVESRHRAAEGGRQVAEARTGTVVAHGVPAKPAPVAQQGDRAVWQPVPGAEGYVVTTSAAEAPELEVGLAVSADLRAGIRVPGVYDVAVVARNDRGRSVPSDPVRFRRGLDVPVITGESAAME